MTAEKKKPTDKQLAILLFIADTIEDRRVSPSYRNITSRFGMELKGVFRMLTALRKLGLVNTTNDADSEIQVTEDGQTVVDEWRAETITIT